MIDYIASIDAGNGGVKAEIARWGGGGRKSHYEPSVRAAASGESLGMSPGVIGELNYEYADWSGHRYITGDDVIRVSRRALERHIGSNRYGNEFHQFLVALALAKSGIKEGEIDLSVFTPPGLFNEQKNDIKKRFLADDGRTEIRLKGDKKPRQWRYTSISILPEGIGAAACFVLDDNGVYIPSDVLSGQVAVIDIGAHTLDALLLVDGNFNAESLQHATWEQGGVHVHIREPILKAIKKLSDDLALVTVDDIDRVIRLGSASHDYTLKAGGYEVDIKPLLDKYRLRYADWIANNIGDNVFNQFRGIKSVILAGGEGLVSDHLRKYYPDKILNPKQHKTTAKVHPIDMNAVGGLRLALMRTREKKVDSL